MEDPKSSSRSVPVDRDLNDFAERAARHNSDQSTAEFSLYSLRTHVRRALAAGRLPVNRVPRRYFLHLLLLLFVPIALVGASLRAGSSAGIAAGDSSATGDLWRVEQRPFLLTAMDQEKNFSALTLDSEQASLAGATTLVADADLPGPSQLTTRNDIQLPGRTTGDPAPPANPQTPSEEEIAAAEEPQGPPVFTGQVSVEKANLRGGPGTNYDKVGVLTADAVVTALARHEDWLQVETAEGQVAWLSSELIDLPSELVLSLPGAAEIPAPPPALVATVNTDNLNLRDGPDTKYVGMDKLAAGTQLDLVARYGEWFQVVTPDGNSGWVTGEYLSMVEGVVPRVPETDSIPPVNPALVGWVTEDSVNLRGGPSTKYDSLGKLASGTELDLLARYKDWYKVETPRGTVGWISADLLEVSGFVKRRIPLTENIPALPQPKPQPAAKPKPKPSGGGSAPAPSAGASGDVASLAWQFVGHPYVWGGERPGGFDCSGLTKYVYGLVGVSLPHNSKAQFSTRYGAIINDMNALQPGDLMFFVNTAGPGITHVGIYVGGGKIIHATTPRTGVIVSNMWDRYWVSHFYAGLRPYR